MLQQALYIRASKAVIFYQEDENFIGYNYLIDCSFVCSHDLMTFLSMVHQWTSFAAVQKMLGSPASADLRSQIEDLIAVGALLSSGGDLAEREENFLSKWHWGIPAAVFHRTVQNRPSTTLAEGEARQREQIASAPLPELYRRHHAMANDTIRLACHTDENSVVSLMARRRTVRECEPVPIALESLSRCLYAGLGIVGTTTNNVGVELPLKMTPSGGARNPYEAFVYARAVTGLAEGIYHYSAFDHSLKPMGGHAMPGFADLLGGQEWADDKPCVVMLCAFMQRTMWKYNDANAYRVVLIEAGHIGQNIMLAATEHGLSACPTAAINHSLVAECLGLEDSLTQSPIYALTLGVPKKAENAGGNRGKPHH
ncbi:SagB family peptide dehydrogenase [Jiella marina]|uniref:SagB family peptide dehydrogenase n=1 Tax=Jiella sp. LLJ827 TaxID=2917712 RepID=UPI0021011DDE|nr:SagB family peptide dehydrogenase [Jiella sp. LLJ827]MCQ0987226.1 SagB/ThcOx family dehydrogenase [Jiella sp. LLJ827]